MPRKNVKQDAENAIDDDAVEAALAQWDDDVPAAEMTEEEQTALDEAAEAAIAEELEAETAASKTSTKQKKSKSKPKAKKEATEEVETRNFADIADHFPNKGQVTRTVNGINAKKVAEKAQNLIAHIETGKKLSGFTVTALGLLKENGEIKTKALIDAFVSEGKTEGTARAQAQQQMALFRTMGIAEPDGDNTRLLKQADNGLVRELLAA